MQRLPLPLAVFASGILIGSPACAPAAGTDTRTADSAEDTVEADAGPKNRIDIPVTVRRNLGITFAAVEARRVAQTIRVPGAFELQPRARNEYRMALPGRVELLVNQYERVEAGQVLFRFQSPSWPELLHEIIGGEQAIATAQAKIVVGRARITETRTLLRLATERLAGLEVAAFKNASLEAEAAALAASLPRLEAELNLLDTELANARRTRGHALHRASTASAIPSAQLEMEVREGDHIGADHSIADHEGRQEQGEDVLVPAYMTIDWIDVRAMQSGVVESLFVTNGAFVPVPAVVLSTIDPDDVRFRALALQADLPALIGADEARIVPPRTPGLSIGDALLATLTLGLEAHPEERTLTLLAIPEERADWVRPGVSAFLEVVVDSSAARDLAVPRSAIVQDGLQHVFFRRDPSDPNRAIRVEADMGVSDGRWVALHSGVTLGDEVVVDGAYELKLATQSDSAGLGGGHVHADGSVHDDH